MQIKLTLIIKIANLMTDYKRRCNMRNTGYVKVWGANNQIVIIEDGMERILGPEGLPGLSITINGNNNLIRIELPRYFEDCKLVIVGDNNYFSILSTYNKTKIKRAFFYISDGCSIEIGRNCYFNNGVTMMAKEKAGVKIVIGDDCVIASECTFRCGDGHTLINEYNGNPLNEPDDIIIEDHVWVGVRCLLLKGTYIAENSVVGAMALVNKKFDIPNVLVAGVPAKIIKSGINWDIADYKTYMDE